MVRAHFIKSVILAVLLLANFASVSTAASRIELGSENHGPVSLAVNGLTAHLRYQEKTENGETVKTPYLDVILNQNKVLTVEGETPFFKWPPAMAQIIDLDPSNPHPEILFETYTGGAHCCTAVKIAVSNSDGTAWSVVDGGMYDGESGGAEDVDEDGVYEIIQVDNSFLYAFSSYAGSYAPSQIWHLEGNKLIDVTRSPKYRFYLKDIANKADDAVKNIGTAPEKNGLLAGYVAIKSLIDEGYDAWNFMLKHYDRKEDTGLERCAAGYDKEGKCKQPEMKYQDFPAALQAFLRETGYLPEK